MSNLKTLKEEAEKEFDKQDFIINNYEAAVDAFDYHILDMPRQIKSFLLSKIDQAYKAGKMETLADVLALIEERIITEIDKHGSYMSATELANDIFFKIKSSINAQLNAKD